jgi:hypothetical protein
MMDPPAGRHDADGTEQIGQKADQERIHGTMARPWRGY